ncbi:MAG: SUMF1/EgtB/PvdO family nonheme iron enzyme [bacterium]
MKKWALIAILYCMQVSGVFANDILISNISLVNRNKSTDIVFVQFDLSWQNSFRTSSGSANWDAAWVFVKYRIGETGEWKHATLNNGGHTIPSGTATTQTDGTGLFFYRDTDGTGTFSKSGIELRWNYGTDGVADDSKIYVKVFAVEMVYIPSGEFQLGSGSQTEGGFRIANDVSTSGTATTFTITSSSPTLQGNNSSSSASNLSTHDGISLDLAQTTNTATLASGFPTGHGAFYSMKYEISQGQYRDFLNTLTYTQQASRTANAPNSLVGTGALISSGTDRNGIEISTSGTNSTIPAVYGCDLNNNGTYDESDDGEWIACNYLSWEDVAAYLDWAALRPITELEYEKLGRGTVLPVTDEYSWGNTTLTGLTAISGARQNNESSNTTNANAVHDNLYVDGPVRVGIFAITTSNRTEAGSGYYGVMELSGNVWEQLITIGNSTGRSFTGLPGNGVLSTAGLADTANWPDNTGTGKRGGSWQSSAVRLRTSDRFSATVGSASRDGETGGRGGR